MPGPGMSCTPNRTICAVPVRTRVPCRRPVSRGGLRTAAEQVLADRQAAGIDGVDPEFIRGDPKARHQLLRRAYDLLARGAYEFLPARVGLLPRPGKEPRKHGIATVSDAIVLRTILDALAEVWDALPSCLVGGRPGADHRDVIRSVSQFLAGGPCFGLRYDVRQAFASAPFGRAIEALRALTMRQDLVELLVRWRRAQPDELAGLVEGSAVAPLLLAVLLGTEVVPHLPRVDRHVVWLDDGLVLSRDPAVVVEVERVLVHRLGQIGGMKLHPTKTTPITFAATGWSTTPWSFLGWAWRGWQAVPSDETIGTLLTELDEMAITARSADIPAKLRGWGGHFGVGQPVDLLDDLDEEILARFAWCEVRLPRLAQICARTSATRRRPASRVSKGRKPREGIPGRTY